MEFNTYENGFLKISGSENEEIQEVGLILHKLSRFLKTFICIKHRI